MERRYDLLSEVGVRDITGYNEAFDRGDLDEAEAAYQGRLVGSESAPDDPGPDRYERLPFIIVVVDELADLMMVAARDVEDSICRIAQMARAVGIHLIIATQRPSVNVITGVIKANVPARLAFAVSSATDSRVILDQVGAERLVGKGDMLFLGPTSSTPARIQGSWVTEEEVRTIAAHWKRQSPQVTYVEEVQGDDGGDAGDMLPGGGTRRRGRRRPRPAGHGADRAQPARLHVDAAAQAQGRLRPRRAAHGHPRAAGRGRARRSAPRPATC